MSTLSTPPSIICIACSVALIMILLLLVPEVADWSLILPAPIVVEVLPKAVSAFNASPVDVNALAKLASTVELDSPLTSDVISVTKSDLKPIPFALTRAVKLAKFAVLVEVLIAVDASCLAFKELIVAKAEFAALVVM